MKKNNDFKTVENQKLVSIIMPAYNSELYISESIESIIKQTYTKWELIIVDDCSNDSTVEIVNQYSKKDSRIKWFQLDNNSGAAIARNLAIEKASGSYLAFLDSDDFWAEGKLLSQINFMEKNGFLFTCTSYQKVDENGRLLNKEVKPELTNDYEDVLRNSPGNSTVVYNNEELGKFYSPNIRRRNDFVMWLKVIKKARTLYGIQESYTYYRVRNDSLSGKKMGLVKYQWQVYREYERLSYYKSLKLLIRKIFEVVTFK